MSEEPGRTDDVPCAPVPQDAAVVLVHGFASAPGVWRGLAERLRDAGYDTVVPTLPGHLGMPPALREVHWSHWTSAVAETLAQARAGHARVFMVGHSLGATLTLHCAASPTPPDAVVLMSPSVSIGARNRLRMAGYRLSGRRSVPWRTIGVDRPPGVPADSPDAAALPLSALRTNLELKSVVARLLPAVRCPVTVLAGARDPLIPAAELERVTGPLPGAPVPVHVLPRAGHTVQLSEDRDEVHRITLAFLADVSRRMSAHPLTR